MLRMRLDTSSPWPYSADWQRHGISLQTRRLMRPNQPALSPATSIIQGAASSLSLAPSSGGEFRQKRSQFENGRLCKNGGFLPFSLLGRVPLQRVPLRARTGTAKRPELPAQWSRRTEKPRIRAVFGTSHAVLRRARVTLNGPDNASSIRATHLDNAPASQGAPICPENRRTPSHRGPANPMISRVPVTLTPRVN